MGIWMTSGIDGAKQYSIRSGVVSFPGGQNYALTLIPPRTLAIKVHDTYFRAALSKDTRRLDWSHGITWRLDAKGTERFLNGVAATNGRGPQWHRVWPTPS